MASSSARKEEEKSLLTLANEAKEYARRYIDSIPTHPEMNTRSEEEFDEAREKLRTMRMLRRETRIELDNTFFDFISATQFSKKYAIGACTELALLALEYIRDQKGEINAELYHISGGDHVFLVLGRKQDSVSNCPESWGEEAIICDPWSDTVFKASDYLKKIKNYYRGFSICKWRDINHTQSFDPQRHTLAPIPHFNVTNLKKTPSSAAIISLEALFQRKLQILLEEMNRYKSLFHSIQQRLEKKYGREDSKFKIITNKLAEINQVIADIMLESSDKEEKATNYEKTHRQLQDKLGTLIERARKTTTFKRVETEKLVACRHFSLFSLPKTAEDITAACHSLNRGLTRLIQVNPG